jgi:hypothetical protein
MFSVEGEVWLCKYCFDICEAFYFLVMENNISTE